jgi:transmembrane sensor
VAIIHLGAITIKVRNMTSNIPWDLFVKLFRNDISEFESQELENWRNMSEINWNIYEEVLNDKNIKEVILSGKWENKAMEWQNFLPKIKPPKAKLTFSFRRFFLTVSSAAVILILIGVSSAFLYVKIKSPVQNGFTYIFSPRGQRTQVVLPDLTKVWLNSESSLRYPVTFNQSKREVYLVGEAFFEVKKDPKVPFYVQTGDIKVKVYGTTFNLKAFPEDNYIETTLIEGKLSVMPMVHSQPTGEEIVMKPLEKLIYEKKHVNSLKKQLPQNAISPSAIVKKGSREVLPEKIYPHINFSFAKEIDLEKDTLWKDGKLIFKNERFDELAIKLARWFDVKIHFENENLKRYSFTGMFDRETINQALDALKISSANTFSYKMIYRDIYLSSQPK